MRGQVLADHRHREVGAVLAAELVRQAEAQVPGGVGAAPHLAQQRLPLRRAGCPSLSKSVRAHSRRWSKNCGCSRSSGAISRSMKSSSSASLRETPAGMLKSKAPSWFAAAMVPCQRSLGGGEVEPKRVLPVDGIRLSDLDFWLRPLEEREGAFATLREERPLSFHEEIEIPSLPPGSGLLVRLTRTPTCSR